MCAAFGEEMYEIYFHHFTILYLLELTPRCFLNFSPPLCGATYLRIIELYVIFVLCRVFNNNNNELVQKGQRGKTAVNLV